MNGQEKAEFFQMLVDTESNFVDEHEISCKITIVLKEENIFFNMSTLDIEPDREIYFRKIMQFNQALLELFKLKTK